MIIVSVTMYDYYVFISTLSIIDFICYMSIGLVCVCVEKGEARKDNY